MLPKNAPPPAAAAAPDDVRRRKRKELPSPPSAESRAPPQGLAVAVAGQLSTPPQDLTSVVADQPTWAQRLVAAAEAAEHQLLSPPGVSPNPLAESVRFSAITRLTFVGRAEEAFIIAEHNINNKLVSESDTKEHLTLVSAAQMFGAGKTQMGIQAVARALQDDVQKRLRATF